jgi:hypothetical protein
MKFCYLLLMFITSTFAQSYKCMVNEKKFIGNDQVTYINYDRHQKTVTHNNGSVSMYIGNDVTFIADVANDSSVTYIQGECNAIGFRYINGKCTGAVSNEILLTKFNKLDTTGAYASLVKSVIDSIPSNEIGWRILGDYDNTEVLYVNKDGFTRSFPNKTQGDKSKSIEFVEIMVNNSMTFYAKDGGVLSKAEIKIDKITGHLRFTIDSFMGYFDFNGTCTTY